jgi:hypothetical protein
VQILNSLGQEEIAIVAFHVSDGIDHCRVGFLQRQFVAHAKTFDGVLAQVTEVYSVGSDSPIKRKKCRHNMGCCLAALISDFPSAEKYTTNTATSTFLAKIAKGEDDGAEDMGLLARSEIEEEGFVSYDDPGASVDTSMTDNGNMLGFVTEATATTDVPTQHCHTPPAKEANKRSFFVAISDLTPTRHSNRIRKKMASAQNNVASQSALTGKRKLQSLGKKFLLVTEVKNESLIQFARQNQLLRPLLLQQQRRQ